MRIRARVSINLHRDHGCLKKAGLDLPESTRLVRIYSSRAMRSQDPWSWFALGPDGRDLQIGSQHSMAVLLEADMLDIKPIRSGVVGMDVDVLPARLNP
ncbi:hypothetical protein GCM10009733_021160 [Nonomuraea maheshkhaliensis]|uniref:Uncharacterized protein n=1 Tax=Nonomuraea maheshkhaliensis TaxID=419590 RepID=A0ABN2EZT2_9ACTN